ncbi:unnamed protein product [Tenebrio molitor]|nr:unnamed protein product [Tenebrio molitor]
MFACSTKTIVDITEPVEFLPFYFQICSLFLSQPLYKMKAKKDHV